jgi:hypothetical protein
VIKVFGLCPILAITYFVCSSLSSNQSPSKKPEAPLGPVMVAAEVGGLWVQTAGFAGGQDFYMQNWESSSPPTPRHLSRAGDPASSLLRSCSPGACEELRLWNPQSYWGNIKRFVCRREGQKEQLTDPGILPFCLPGTDAQSRMERIAQSVHRRKPHPAGNAAHPAHCAQVPMTSSFPPFPLFSPSPRKTALPFQRIATRTEK